MAKIDQLFTVAGTSRHPELGMKVRTSNTAMYVKALLKVEHDDIVLIELPSPMTKVEAVQFIKALPEFASADQQEAIDYFLDRKAPKVKKEKVKATTVVDSDAYDSDAGDESETMAIDSSLEDAPF